MIKNIGLLRLEKSTSETFVTETGIKIRKKIFKMLQKPLVLATPKKMVVENYPKLEKGKPYIYTSTHNFDGDINVALANLDRNAFLLLGSKDQLEYNKGVYFAWLNGLIYVDRLDPESRKESLKKMTRILKSGTSILMFPEGQYNNTENLLCERIFAGPYKLYKETGAKIIPVSSYTLPELDEIYINYGEPIDFDELSKKEALIMLRDILATMQFEQIEKHGGMLVRKEMTSKDIHLDYLEERLQEYLKENWTRDVWDEEIIEYIDKDIIEAKKVREFIDKVEITPKNAYIMAPILVQREKDEKYDFKKYVRKNWKR